MPPISAPDGRPVGAVRGLIQTMLLLLRQSDVTHIACAFDHVVESFRNEMFEGYKTGEGVPEDLMAQFGLAERAVASLGVIVWPMVEFEADDAMATAATRWRSAPGVDQIVICSPDKDLAQVVHGDEVVCYDRRRKLTMNEAGVTAKFGVQPGSIPDYLALVGDAADGIPGIPRWGTKASARVLARYFHIEEIPVEATDWAVEVRGAAALAKSLDERRQEAFLYRTLATLRTDVPLGECLANLEWRGVFRAAYLEICAELGFPGLTELPHLWADE